jgi:hypothetical protein
MSHEPPTMTASLSDGATITHLRSIRRSSASTPFAGPVDRCAPYSTSCSRDSARRRATGLVLSSAKARRSAPIFPWKYRSRWACAAESPSSQPSRPKMAGALLSAVVRQLGVGMFVNEVKWTH